MLTKKFYLATCLAMLFIATGTYPAFSQQQFQNHLRSSTSSSSTNKKQGFSSITASAKYMYKLNQYNNESRNGYEIAIGLSLGRYHSFGFVLSGYEVYVVERIKELTGLDVVLPAGGVEEILIGLRYQTCFAVLTEMSMAKHFFINFDISIPDDKDKFIALSISPEYKFQLSEDLKLPIGLKYIRAINATDNILLDRDFIGIFAGFEINK